jgi:hypothetical protein
MSDDNKFDWGEFWLTLACVVGGFVLTVLFIYIVALIQIHA